MIYIIPKYLGQEAAGRERREDRGTHPALDHLYIYTVIFSYNIQFVFSYCFITCWGDGLFFLFASGWILTEFVAGLGCPLLSSTV